jgi:hypothetical protein
LKILECKHILRQFESMDKYIICHGQNVFGSEGELIFAFDDHLNELKRKRGSYQMDEGKQNFIEFEFVLAS